MKATPRSWTEEEIKLLGTMPDGELGRLLGRPSSSVWGKRKSLNIPQNNVASKPWTSEEDSIIRQHPVKESAKILGRTEISIQSRLQRIQAKRKRAGLITQEQAFAQIRLRPYESQRIEERVRFVGGPYAPPTVPLDGELTCAIHGKFKVAGYTNALIPWPVAEGHSKQLIVCGDLITALRTESRLAVAYHFGISPQQISFYRAALGIERLNPGSHRLFRRTIDLARTDAARRKMSRAREGKPSKESHRDRERLRHIQRRPKSEEWKQRMSERLRRKFLISGRDRPWTETEIALIGTRPDREVARMVGRSLSAVRGKKFQLGLNRRGREIGA